MIRLMASYKAVPVMVSTTLAASLLVLGGVHGLSLSLGTPSPVIAAAFPSLVEHFDFILAFTGLCFMAVVSLIAWWMRHREATEGEIKKEIVGIDGRLRQVEQQDQGMSAKLDALHEALNNHVSNEERFQSFVYGALGRGQRSGDAGAKELG